MKTEKSAVLCGDWTALQPPPAPSQKRPSNGLFCVQDLYLYIRLTDNTKEIVFWTISFVRKGIYLQGKNPRNDHHGFLMTVQEYPFFPDIGKFKEQFNLEVLNETPM